MNQARRPHAIHGLRRRMNAVSAKARACGETAAEAAHQLGRSLEFGGTFHEQNEAAALLEKVIADLRMIAVETAVLEHEPGHTRRTRAAMPEQPAMLGARL